MSIFQVFPPLPAAYFTGTKSTQLNIRLPNPERKSPPWLETIQGTD